MDEQRKILDALMGANRNGEPVDQKSFTDEDVCKFFLVGFCPVELFINTKMDVGECKKLHQEALKDEYDEARKKKDYGYDLELERELEGIISDCDRKINNARKRLEHNQEVEKQHNAAEEDEHAPEIERLLKKVEELGEEGQVDESMKVMEQVNVLRAQQTTERAKKAAINGPTLIPALEIGPPSNQQQKLRVCDVCAALLSIVDSDRRLADHFGGRLHLGYVKVREKLAELRAIAKARPRGDDRGGYRDPRDERSRNDDRDRDRQRDRDRIASDRDRDFARDRDRGGYDRDRRDDRRRDDRGYDRGGYDNRYRGGDSFRGDSRGYRR